MTDTKQSESQSSGDELTQAEKPPATSTPFEKPQMQVIGRSRDESKVETRDGT